MAVLRLLGLGPVVGGLRQRLDGEVVVNEEVMGLVRIRLIVLDSTGLVYHYPLLMITNQLSQVLDCRPVFSPL